MKKFLTTVLLLAALTALILAGCGNDTNPASSAPEGIGTFGVSMNPSAVPSTAPTAAQNSPTVAVPSTQKPSVSGEPGVQITSAPVSPSPTKTPAPSATVRPSTAPTAKPSPSPSDKPPVPSAPAPTSTTTPTDAAKYIGKSASTLLDEQGFPGGGRDYEPVDEDDPSAGEIGTFYYDGFTVTTKRAADGTETVTAVTSN